MKWRAYAVEVVSVVVLGFGLSGLGAGCGSQPKPVGAQAQSQPAPDAAAPMTEIQRRQTAACQAVGPKLTECAIADAKASLSPEEFAKLKPEELATKHTESFIANCTKDSMSSRQVRVLEVCFKEETECAPLLTCLENLQPKASTGEQKQP